MKDLGELHHFLGMHVQRHGDGLLLSQRQYMLEYLIGLVWQTANLFLLRLTPTPRFLQLMVHLSQIRLIFAAWQAHSSTSPSPDQILPMLFSRSASTCTTRENPIWLP